MDAPERRLARNPLTITSSSIAGSGRDNWIRGSDRLLRRAGVRKKYVLAVYTIGTILWSLLLLTGFWVPECGNASCRRRQKFATVVMQVRAGQERTVAFNSFVKRTGIEDIKSLSAIIVQSEKFGTSLAEALKVYAEALRARRRLRAEAAGVRGGGSRRRVVAQELFSPAQLSKTRSEILRPGASAPPSSGFPFQARIRGAGSPGVAAARGCRDRFCRPHL